jgi:general secretion pathway protein J
MKQIYSKNSGFTLVEVLVASIIGGFVAAVAVTTLRTMSVSAEIVDTNANAAAEVRFAAGLIARDLQNLYRNEDLEEMLFFGTSASSTALAASDLTFYTVGRAKARYDQPEGDVYEVEYSLVRRDEESALMRRWWPNPDKEAEPRGIVAPIAEDIDVFAVRFYNGEEWLDEWPQEAESVPELVEVLIVAAPETGDPIMETFVVSFPRSTWQQDSEDEGEEEESSR